MYPDFHQVTSQDNIDYLEYHYPEIASSLGRQPDSLEKFSDIYKTIKKLVPNISNAKKDAAKADANFAKPKSMSTMGSTQNMDGNSARLTEERRAANWERMQKTLKGLS